jgi:hypothetical protein
MENEPDWEEATNRPEGHARLGEIPEQASREQDPAKLRELASELCDLLEKQLEFTNLRACRTGCTQCTGAVLGYCALPPLGRSRP